MYFIYFNTTQPSILKYTITHYSALIYTKIKKANLQSCVGSYLTIISCVGPLGNWEISFTKLVHSLGKFSFMSASFRLFNVFRMVDKN